MLLRAIASSYGYYASDITVDECILYPSMRRGICCFALQLLRLPKALTVTEDTFESWVAPGADEGTLRCISTWFCIRRLPPAVLW